jgi:uncharacterized protein
MDHKALALEMRGLREQVTGITDTALAAADGLLIAADTADSIDPEGLAARSPTAATAAPPSTPSVTPR